MREKITIVAGDGAKWIDTCADLYFPNATRCIDFFHVAEWANEKLDKVRTATASKASAEYEKRKNEFLKAEAEAEQAAQALEKERQAAEAELESMPKRGRPSHRKLELLQFLEAAQEAAQPEGHSSGKRGRPRKENLSAEHQEILDQLLEKAKSIKGAKHALGHNPENCTDGQNEKIKLIENNYPDLYRAYQLKESIRLILHMNDVQQLKVNLTNGLQMPQHQNLNQWWNFLRRLPATGRVF